MPAIENILAVLSASASVHLLVEVISADEARPLQSAAQLVTQWLPRDTDQRDAGLPLERALRALQTVPPSAKIYLVCEAAAMRRILKLLQDELGVDRQYIVGRGYWELDTINYSDHDHGESD